MEFTFVLLVLACDYIEGNVTERNNSDHTEVIKKNATNATTLAHFAAVTPLERRMLDESAAFRRPTEHEMQPVQKNASEENMDRARRDERLLASGLVWNNVDRYGSTNEDENVNVDTNDNDDSVPNENKVNNDYESQNERVSYGIENVNGDGVTSEDEDADFYNRLLDKSTDFHEGPLSEGVDGFRSKYESQNERVRTYGIENGNGDDITSEDEDVYGRPYDEDTGFYDGPLDNGVDDFGSESRTLHLHFTAMSPRSRAIMSRMLSLLSDEVRKSPRGPSGFGSGDAEYDVIKKDPCTRKHLHLAVEELKWGCRGVMKFYDKVCKEDYAMCMLRRKKRRCVPQLCKWARRRTRRPCYLKVFGCN